MKSTVSSTTSTATSSAFETAHPERALREDIVVTPSVAKPHVLVLLLRARIDLVLPLLLVAVERRVVERGRVGLALIRALLVVDHLRTLAASSQCEGRSGQDHHNGCRANHRHDLVPP